MAGLTALLLAGRRPGVDPLAASRGETLKALIPVAGTPMVARVARTLAGIGAVGRVVVLTQDVAAIAAVLPAKGVVVLPSQDGIARSIVAAATEVGVRFPMLVTTADHPLLKAKTIRRFLREADGADVAVGVVERRVVEARFPGTRRTWLRFRSGAWTGANLFYLGTPKALPVVQAWAAIEQDRKKGRRVVSAFGPGLLLRALTRTITLHAAVARAGARLGADARAVALDDPLAAVDVDKASDLALAEQVLEGRQ